MSDVATWRGIAIEESFTRPMVPPGVHHVSTRSGRLGGEEDKGEVRFHAITVNDGKLDSVTDWARRNLRPGWYMHLVKGKRMRIVFPDHVFDIIKDDHEGIERVRRFGIDAGVHPKQLPLEKLFEDPFA